MPTHPFTIIRRVLGISLRDLEKLSGLSRTIISQIENNKVTLTEESRKKLTDALRVASLRNLSETNLFLTIGSRDGVLV